MTVRECCAELGVALPPDEELWRLADLTGLRRDPADGRFYRSNYERGALLYALVAARRPKAILEYGTGRAFGCLVMARALVDHGIDGRIHTIDRLRNDEVFDWPLDRGDGPRAERHCRDEILAEAASPGQLERIDFLCGSAAGILPRWRGPEIDFAFIDGDHRFAGVQHDFLALTQIAGPRLGVLFDDYDGKDEFGVDRLVRETVAPHFDCTVITNDGAWAGGEGHAMAFAQAEGEPGWLRSAYPPAAVSRIVAPYRRADALRPLVAPLRRLIRRLRGS